MVNDTAQLGRGGELFSFFFLGAVRSEFFLFFLLLPLQSFECYFTSSLQAMRQSCRDGFSQSGLAGLALSFDRLYISLSQAYRGIVSLSGSTAILENESPRSQQS